MDEGKRSKSSLKKSFGRSKSTNKKLSSSLHIHANKSSSFLSPPSSVFKVKRRREIQNKPLFSKDSPSSQSSLLIDFDKEINEEDLLKGSIISQKGDDGMESKSLTKLLHILSEEKDNLPGSFKSNSVNNSSTKKAKNEDEKKLDNRIFVSVRMRPPNSILTKKVLFSHRELNESLETECSLIEPSPIDNYLLVKGAPNFPSFFKDKKFHFDHVFGATHTQQTVYDSMKNMVRDIPRGINTCLIAYGQTGAGKTFTLTESSSGEKAGMLPRAIRDIFHVLEQEKDEFLYDVSVSYMQIYMEDIQDLLKPENKNLQIREDSSGKVYVHQLSYHKVRNLNDVLLLIDYGNRAKMMAQTKLNRYSSRSHTVFILSINKRHIQTGKQISSKFTCCDLAGSERTHKTQATGLQLDEARFINLSLSSIGNVIAALSIKKEKSSKTNRNNFVPWRNSKLTRVLQDSLSGNSRVYLFINVAPENSSYQETITSLLFGQRAMNVSVKPKMNENMDYKNLANQLQEKLEKVQTDKGKRITDLMEKNDILASEAGSIFVEFEKVRKRMDELLKEREELEMMLNEKTQQNLHLSKLLKGEFPRISLV